MYCAFYVETDTPRWTAWADGVLAHLASEQSSFPGPAEHLYFGGGTPSLAPPDTLGRIVAAVDRRPDAEVTIEANPGTVESTMLDLLVEQGINRVSVGIQTFQPRLARLLSRAHTVEDAQRLLSLVRTTAGLRSWSADLIFAIPGQTLAELDDDLSQMIDSGAPHVSIYALSYEPGTPLTRARDRGKLTPLSAEAWSEQYDLVVQRLESAGLERYEVSNFARPGHRARHNEHVWRAGHYMGLGPSAHGFRPDGTRTLAPADVNAWLDHPRGTLEHPQPRDAAIDFLLSSLRHREGVRLTHLKDRTKFCIRTSDLRPHVARGLLEIDASSIRIGSNGWHVADGLVRALVDALQSADNMAGDHT